MIRFRLINIHEELFLYTAAFCPELECLEMRKVDKLNISKSVDFM